VRWRRARDEWFLDASANLRLDSFRSAIEELPSLGIFRARAPIARLGALELLHTGDVRAQYLRRREGEAGARSPFALPTTFADGLGERELVRLDSAQRLEAPMALGVAGLRATPFVGARATGWSEGEDPDASPARLVNEAGLRLASTLWRPAAAGAVHQLVPYVELRHAAEHEIDDGEPLAIDRVEEPQGGDFLTLGTRLRWGARSGRSTLDLDLRQTHADDTQAGAADGWLPLGVFARLEVRALGVPIEVWHDGRYDLDDGDTTYTLTNLALRPSPDLGLEAGYRRGLDAAGAPLFEAATIAGSYQWTEKWEFEGRQTLNLLESGRLDSTVLVRRDGHDFIVELEASARAGEGGTGLSFKVRPRFGYQPSDYGYLGD
jgi:hypothetical protein